ncbi:hypothetical protein [Aliarcobacter butzleri]|uniref:hypothetical protein n=1 Tax=Aliarcobacter butzleri TaxID=28197 RepID=UPI00125FEB03|nr:hypothetical protein [Aliarcobacter butzleri]
MEFLPKKVHFGLGFGFKYQAMLVLILNILMKKRFFMNGVISSENKLYIKNELLSENTFTNSDKFILSLEEMLKVDNISPKNIKKQIILIEGEPHYFEDINIFFKNRTSDYIFSYQVKGNSQFKKDGTENSNSVNQTVKKALLNIIDNENIKNYKNIKFIILTNKDVSNHFFLRNDSDIEKLIDEILSLINNIKFLEKNITKHCVYTYLREVIKKLIMNNAIITKFGILKAIILNNISLSKKNRKFLLEKIDKNLISKLENLRYLIKNLKVIPYLDERLIYLFLKNYYPNNSTFHFNLSTTELRAMDANFIRTKIIKKNLKRIGFTDENINNIKFSQDSNKFKIGKIY